MAPNYLEMVIVPAMMIGSLVLLVMAIIDAVKNPYLTENERIIWVIVICLVGFIGPILYFLVGKRTSRR